MKAVIASIYSPDVQDLETYRPDGAAFRVFLQLLIGPGPNLGDESFDLEVCSTKWLEEQALPILGRHKLIVNTFEFPVIREFLEKVVGEYEADNWHDLAQKLRQIGKWDFEDYQSD
jgi:immunity protein 8 of polymorphic toxin system